MVVAVLGSRADLLLKTETFEDAVLLQDTPSPAEVKAANITHLISFGHSRLIPVSTLEAISGLAVNVHISLLPWNRGSDPNFWSWLENTPKGVSVHLMDDTIDTGPVLIQDEVFFSTNETLRSSYNKLTEHGVHLITSNWRDFINKGVEARAQSDFGSHHKRDDIEKYRFLLRDSWDTSCNAIRDWGFENGLHLQ